MALYGASRADSPMERFVERWAQRYRWRMRPWPCTARCSWVGVSHRPVQGVPADFALGARPALAPPAPRCGGLRGAPDLAPSRWVSLVLRAPYGRGAGSGPFR